MESIRKKLFKTEADCNEEIQRLRALLQNQCLSPELIPYELSNSHQWVVWSYQAYKKWNGMYRANKQPYQPTNPYLELDRDNFIGLSDLHTAISSFDKCEHIDGIGYMFLESDGLVGIDLDNCRNQGTGKIRREYLYWIKQFDSYTEVSPSGTGIKIWVKGSVPSNYFLTPEDTGLRILNFACGEIEIYRRGQYFTVTTQVMPGFDTIRYTQNEIDVICEFSQSYINKDFSNIPFSGRNLEEINTELSFLAEEYETENVYIDQDDLQDNPLEENEAIESIYINQPAHQILNQFRNEIIRLQKLKYDIEMKRTDMEKNYQLLTVLEIKKVEKYQKEMQLFHESRQREVILSKISAVVDQNNTSVTEPNQIKEQYLGELTIESKNKKETISQLHKEISQLKNQIYNLERLIQKNQNMTFNKNIAIHLQIEDKIDILISEKRQIEEDIGKRLFELSVQND